MCQSCITVSRAPERGKAIWLKRQSDQLLRAMTASKETKKHQLLKAQGIGGSQFDCPTEVSKPHTAIFTFIALLFQQTSTFFRGHRFFFGRFESTSSAKSFFLRHIIDIDNNIIEYTITCAFS